MDPALYDYVRRRDGACVASYANSPFWSSRWPMLQGLPDAGFCEGPLTLDHVKRELAMAMRAPDDPAHLWTVCRGHHTDTRAGRQWATNEDVRAAARTYIDAANAAALTAGWPPLPGG